jgi:hypothetical protein
MDYNQLIETIDSNTIKLSYSALKNLNECPRDFVRYKLRQIIKTDAMIFGDLVHTMALSPDEFERKFYVMQEKRDLRTKYGKAEMARIELIAEGKEVIKLETYLEAERMVNTVFSNRASSHILERIGKTEVLCEWQYRDLNFIGFKDGEGDGVIFDLKTVADANPIAVQRDIVKNLYHLQAAMYLKATGGKKQFAIVAVDKTLNVSVHLLHSDILKWGQQTYDKLIDAYNDCKVRDSWNESYEYYSEFKTGFYMADRPPYSYK